MAVKPRAAKPKPTNESPGSALLLALRAAYAEAGDAERAKSQQAYMKSEMPYHGVTSGEMRAICKALFKEHPIADKAAFREAALHIWRSATHREERYAAIELTGLKVYKRHQAPDLLPMYEEMIVTGAWWDYVDVIAIHRVGPILLAHPGVMDPLMRAWSKDKDLWKRRTSIICQVAAKQQTDMDLLYANIEVNLADKGRRAQAPKATAAPDVREDFFIRKAIGWALRQVAWWNPKEIARYVAENEHRMSGLSKREALKNLKD